MTRYKAKHVHWWRVSPGRYEGEDANGSRWLMRQWGVQDWRLYRDGIWEDYSYHSMEAAMICADGMAIGKSEMLV